jgi:hypothetical protein
MVNETTETPSDPLLITPIRLARCPQTSGDVINPPQIYADLKRVV